MLKQWVLYIILAWQSGPLLPEEQKTVLLQFDSIDECMSIAAQVDEQVKAAKAVFYLKTIGCYVCHDVYTKNCPPSKPAKKR